MSSPAAAVQVRAGLMPLAIGWAAILLWGGSPVATRLAVLGIDPLAVGILRTLLAALLALPLALLLGLRLPRERGGWTLMLGAALGSYVLFPILFSLGLRHTTASHAALVHASTPLFTGVIAALLERRWPGRWWWVGVAVALLGELLLIGLGRGFAEPGVTVYGDLVVLYMATSSCSRPVSRSPSAMWLAAGSPRAWAAWP
jgi:drug/metabolite transporter (DMT)-like permease